MVEAAGLTTEIVRVAIMMAADNHFGGNSGAGSVPSVALQPPAVERIYSAGAWRNFPALMHLHDNRASLGCFDWVFFVDDDSFVYVRALEALLGRFPASATHYLGVYHTARVDLEWIRHQW